MKGLLYTIVGALLCPIFGYAQNTDTNQTVIQEKAVENQSQDSNQQEVKEKKTVNLVTDSLFLAEKATFDNEIEYVKGLLEEEKKKEGFEQLTTFETVEHGFKFIKEFTTPDNKIYHYVMFDAQLHSSMFHFGKSKKDDIVYQDELLKLEVEGPMRLYSIILAEKIIGSLESFKRVYYTVYDEKALRVTESGSGQHHFFREFEKMYYDGDKTILKGKKFRSIKELVHFYNNNLPDQQNQ